MLVDTQTPRETAAEIIRLRDENARLRKRLRGVNDHLTIALDRIHELERQVEARKQGASA